MFRKYISCPLEPHSLSNGNRVMESLQLELVWCKYKVFVRYSHEEKKKRFMDVFKALVGIYIWYVSVVKLILLSMKKTSCIYTLFSCASNKKLVYPLLSVYFSLYLSVYLCSSALLKLGHVGRNWVVAARCFLISMTGSSRISLYLSISLFICLPVRIPLCSLC